MLATVIAFAATLAAFVLAFVAVSYERELRAMSRFLERRDRNGNERISVEFSTRGISGVAKAVNAELDARRDARIERDRREEAFRQDLASLSHDIRTPLAICSFASVRMAMPSARGAWPQRKTALPLCAP